MTASESAPATSSNWWSNIGEVFTGLGSAAGSVIGATNQTKASDLVKLANAQAAQQQAANQAQANQQKAWIMPVLIGGGILIALGLVVFAFTRK